MKFEEARREMVKKIRGVYGLKSPEVLGVMERVPRHNFIAEKYQNIAYGDQPLDIGYGQTMSQPYTVALMTHLATINSKLKSQNSKFKLKTQKLKKVLEIGTPLCQGFVGQAENIDYGISEDDAKFCKLGRVLEVGTGSGYQAAVLSYFFNEVYSIEIVPKLSHLAGGTLARLGYKNVFVKTGSGEEGWKEHAPFDAMVITAGVERVPKELFKQLKAGGVLVAPVGEGEVKIMTRYTRLIIPHFAPLSGATRGKQKSIHSASSGLMLSKTVASKIKINNNKSIESMNNNKYLIETFGTFRFVPFVEKQLNDKIHL